MAQWAWAEAVAGDPDVADELLVGIQRLAGRGVVPQELTPSIAHARAFALVRRGRFTESYAPQIAAAEASRRIGRHDLAYGAWANAASAAACAGELHRALEFIDRGIDDLAGHGLDSLELSLLAGRAHVLLRLGREAEAREAAERQLAIADRLADPEHLATARHDVGLLALRLGEADRAARLLRSALDLGARVSRPQLRLALAEALVDLGRLDEAEHQLRSTALEPVTPGDLPSTLVPRLTWVQGRVARARGDRELARRRFVDAAEGWQALVDGASAAEEFVAVLADFGRPPLLGLVEPERELSRVRADPASLSSEGAADALLPG
jgi:tetratricopeptide (TPR) repeat protein